MVLRWPHHDVQGCPRPIGFLPFTGINGGPQPPFSEAASFTVSCKDQDEVDYYRNRLTDGGEESQCGCCKDRFGLSWQIVPDRLYELVSDPDPVIADLEKAAEQAATR
jgi:predicted 3-demethylubiquinone-9 3-methyltransferase (glyoxalase superfamily)